MQYCDRFLYNRGNQLCAVLRSVAHSCPTLCDPMGCSPPGSSVHGILQARSGVRCHAPPPGDLPKPGWNPGLPHCRQICYCLSDQGTICVHIHLLPPEPPSHHCPPSCASRSSQSTELSSLHYTSTSHWLCVLLSSIYMLMSLSKFIPLSSFPTVSTCRFSTSVIQS